MNFSVYIFVIASICLGVSQSLETNSKDDMNLKGIGIVSSDKTSLPQAKRTGHFLNDYFGYGFGGGYYGNGYGYFGNGYGYGYPYYYPGNYGSTGEFASTCADSYPNRRYSCYGLGR